jgi:hypothetical protein
VSKRVPACANRCLGLLKEAMQLMDEASEKEALKEEVLKVVKEEK